MVDEEIAKCNDKSSKLVDERNAAIGKIGNFIHDSCIIDNDEVSLTISYMIVMTSELY